MQPELLRLKTSDNLSLEAELIVPDKPIAAAVLTHPHPRHGGNMASMVPGELFVALPAQNVATLRFNFRGMGQSEGTFDDGQAEKLDVAAALDVLAPITEGLALVLCGSSFGADTALCTSDERISAWCGLAPPLRDEKLADMQTTASSSRPKHLVVAARDQIRDPEAATSITKAWTNTTIEIIDGADHFFVGRIERAIQSCVSFVLAQS